LALWRFFGEVGQLLNRPLVVLSFSIVFKKGGEMTQTDITYIDKCGLRHFATFFG